MSCFLPFSLRWTQTPKRFDSSAVLAGFLIVNIARNGRQYRTKMLFAGDNVIAGGSQDIENPSIRHRYGQIPAISTCKHIIWWINSSVDTISRDFSEPSLSVGCQHLNVNELARILRNSAIRKCRRRGGAMMRCEMQRIMAARLVSDSKSICL
jgi:hypothetical protein